MSVTKYHTGEVRLVWRVLIAVSVCVAAAFLLRFIPIFLYTALQTSRGVDRQDALETAKAIVFEHRIWSTAIGIINALVNLSLVWFMIRVVEKGPFAWNDVGLHWRRYSLLSLAFGALLAIVMYVAGIVTDRVLGYSIPTIETIFAGLTISAVVRNLALYIPMGFGEEVLFRGYVQTRLIERLGALWGILIGSILFTLLHLLGRPLSPANILSAVILWAAVGNLYHWTTSLYLVGMFHAVANTLLNVLPSDRSDPAGLIVHLLALLLIVVLCRRTSKSSHPPLNLAPSS